LRLVNEKYAARGGLRAETGALGRSRNPL
jgi:hypothetical protein